MRVKFRSDVLYIQQSLERVSLSLLKLFFLQQAGCEKSRICFVYNIIEVYIHKIKFVTGAVEYLENSFINQIKFVSHTLECKIINKTFFMFAKIQAKHTGH